MNLKTIRLSLILASLSLMLAACGGKKETASGTGAGSAVTEDGVRIVEITANDQMKFSLKEIRVKAGEPVRLTLKNIGKMPKQSMGHNWVLIQPVDQAGLTSFALSAASRPPQYLPADKTLIIAHSRILGPGESETIEFKAPSTAGIYRFLCTFPGHYNLMNGNFIVE